MAENDPDLQLWSEYKRLFTAFDDLSLARWLSQTLGQFAGGLWRVSHPLVNAYRMASEAGNDRDIWNQRLATIPAGFVPANCCRAPLLPLFSRDIATAGLLCPHCGGTAVEWDDISRPLREKIEPWAESYKTVHAVAHYEEGDLRPGEDLDDLFEQAAKDAEQLLRQAALEILPPFLEEYPAVLWEDQDECLEVEAKDIETWS